MWRGSIRVKFGPTVAVFRGEATLAFDHTARTCTIEGRGIDGRGASRALATGNVKVTGKETTELAIDGNFSVSGPLETFANAGGVHVARALLAEFSTNLAKLVTLTLPVASAREAPRPSMPRPSMVQVRAVWSKASVASPRNTATVGPNFTRIEPRHIPSPPPGERVSGDSVAPGMHAATSAGSLRSGQTSSTGSAIVVFSARATMVRQRAADRGRCV